MKTGKSALLKLFFILAAASVSCNPSGSNGQDDILPRIEVSKVVTENGKTFLEVDGVPYTVFGAQIRLDAFLNCDKMKVADVEKYIAKAKGLNVNAVQIGITWSMVETAKDVYDYSIVDSILKYIKKHELKMELLWFGSNFCGDSYSYHIPSYALSDYDKKLWRNDEGAFWDYYGYQYSLILDDAWVMEREGAALANLMNHIRSWDSQNGDYHPIISVQVENEPDCLVRWRIDQKGLKYRDGTPLTKEKGWQMALNSLDRMGKVVQNSSYKVVTRSNIVYNAGLGGFGDAPNASPRDVFNLAGIDIIGTDSYRNRVADIAKDVSDYASLAGNYAHVAENKGSYENTPGLILAAAAAGGGYCIYDLATSYFFITHTGLTFEEIDHGVFTYDLQEKPHTELTRLILKGLTAAYVDVARCGKGDFAAFNVSENLPMANKSQAIQTTGTTISFETSAGALGFVVDMKDHLLVYATADASFTFGNGTFGAVATGSYDSRGEFVSSGTASLVSGKLNAQGGTLYKVSCQSSGALASNTMQFVGNNS